MFLLFHLPSMFTGTIPETLAGLTNLREFLAFDNSLEGTFPDALCTLKEPEFHLTMLSVDCKEVVGCDCCDMCLK